MGDVLLPHLVGTGTLVHCLSQAVGDRMHGSWSYLPLAFGLKGVGYGIHPHGGYKGTVLVEHHNRRHWIIAHYSPFFHSFCGRGEGCALVTRKNLTDQNNNKNTNDGNHHKNPTEPTRSVVFRKQKTNIIKQTKMITSFTNMKKKSKNMGY